MRKALIIWTLLALTIVVIEACVFTDSYGGPARKEGPQFDHAGHIERGVGCSDCHGGEAEGYMARPTLETCNECHEEFDADAPPEKRATIFFDAAGKAKWERTWKLGEEVIFSHKAHAARDTECMQCHADVAASKAVPASSAMTMGECMECHRAAAPAQNECASCHREHRQDRAPPSHRLGWLHEHGRVARLGGLDPLPQDCSICHTRSSCDTCHKEQAPRNHNNLWRVHGHAAAASIDREGCAVCHTTDSCVACHEQALPRSHRGAWGAPFNGHCFGCHLPLQRGADEGCAVCHRNAPSHMSAPPRPDNPAHMTSNPNDCRRCHTPMPHADNGQSCFFCHK